MNYAERAAKAIVEELTGGMMVFRNEQSRGWHDFDLEYPHGEQVPVEVTSSVDVEKVEAYAAIRKRGSCVQRHKCRDNWLVHPLPDANIRRIRNEVDRYLAAIEVDHLTSFHTYAHAYEYPSVAAILRDLRVESGAVVRTEGIQIGYPGSGGAIGAETAAQAITLEAMKQDNRQKLGRTGARERHLFVYIDATNFLPWAGLREFDPSVLKPPSLPDEITDLWAAAGAGWPAAYTVWRARAAGWQTAGVVVLDDTQLQ
jgi:hypothetical protein